MNGKNTLVIYSSVNVTRNDAKGAFIPEAEAFAKCHGVPPENVYGIDCKNQKPERRFEELCVILRDHCNVEHIALFCHGWSSRIQFGMTKKNIWRLVQFMRLGCVEDVKLVLYACSTASTNKKTRKRNAPGTNNGYADKLRDEMLKQGFRGGWIDAHLTPGHATQNPFLMRFLVEPVFEDEWDVHGGEWIVSPKSTLWPDWKRGIQTELSDFRFLFPAWADLEIYRNLGGYE